jgi:hydroxymethyl cephem carbamoyltransferase
MLVLAFNSGHDGAFAAVEDGRLLFCQEAEKDSFLRHSPLSAIGVLNAVEHLGATPEVIAFTGGWRERVPGRIGIGYLGADRVDQRPMNFLGQRTTLVSSSHERSHIMSSIALAPRDDEPIRAALIWEGLIGKLYLVDGYGLVIRELEVQDSPGTRWALLFGLADPSFADDGYPRDEDAGKLMALAAFSDASEAGPAVTEIVDRVLTTPHIWPAAKHEFRDTPIYNAGVEADVTKTAAALLSARLFDCFARAAREHLPPGIPLHISGGCGLNCDWNRMWLDLDYFSSVFVPPCPNDAGLAIGSAADALRLLTGDPYIDWDVYAGLDFECDTQPDQSAWRRRELDLGAVADALAAGRVFAWVQGRAELGPRALGNRSLLAHAADPRIRERLNDIKQREQYRPIAPCCRLEDTRDVFDADFEDPYMLYFRRATTNKVAAATHVDGTARCQTVTRATNRRLYDLLTAVAARSGTGALCNTSLNFKGLGFINKMSDLTRYCTDREVDDFVVGDVWYERLPVAGG